MVEVASANPDRTIRAIALILAIELVATRISILVLFLIL
jgi:hypothetical protein